MWFLSLHECARPWLGTRGLEVRPQCKRHARQALEHTQGTSQPRWGKAEVRGEPRRRQIGLRNPACRPALEPNTSASSHFHINHIPSKTSQLDFLRFPNFCALQQSCQWFSHNVVLIGGEGKLGCAALASPVARWGGLVLVLEPGESHQCRFLSCTDFENLP